MNDKLSNPLDTIIDFAWASGADRFWVNNAKDELKNLRKKLEGYQDGSSGIRKELAEETSISGS
jgi:hypothetical protein